MVRKQRVRKHAIDGIGDSGNWPRSGVMASEGLEAENLKTESWNGTGRMMDWTR